MDPLPSCYTCADAVIAQFIDSKSIDPHYCLRLIRALAADFGDTPLRDRAVAYAHAIRTILNNLPGGNTWHVFQAAKLMAPIDRPD